MCSFVACHGSRIEECGKPGACADVSQVETRTSRRRPRAERVGAICRAAKAAFAEHGYEGAVMADIAARAGIAEGTVYTLFATKRDLLHTVMAEWYAHFTAELARLLAGLDDPLQQLRCLIWHHLSVIEADPALCRVFFREIRAFDDYAGSAMFALNRDYTAHAVKVLEDGVARGVFRADIPLTCIRDTVFGGLEHHAWQYLAGRKPLDVPRATQAFHDLVVRAIAVEAPPAAVASERLERVAARLEALTTRLEAAGA